MHDRFQPIDNGVITQGAAGSGVFLDGRNILRLGLDLKKINPIGHELQKRLGFDQDVILSRQMREGAAPRVITRMLGQMSANWI